MQNHPQISIIVPVYNAEKYLHQCVDSILNQSFTDFELLLIDDGSTDLSGTICDEYTLKDKRVRVIHKENAGPSSARNTGLDNAIGEYVCFVDSDDYLNDSFLYHYMRKPDKADLTYYSFKYNDEINHNDCIEHFENTIISDKNNIEEFIQPIRYRSYQSCIVDVPWGKFYKNDIINRHHLRFPEDINFKEDEIFNYRYLKYVQTLEVCDFVGYNYRLLPNSLARREFSNELLYSLARHWIVEADNFGIVLKKDILQRACVYLMKVIYRAPSLTQKYYIARQILSINSKYQVHLQHIARVASKFGVSLGSLLLVGLVVLGNIKRKFLKA